MTTAVWEDPVASPDLHRRSLGLIGAVPAALDVSIVVPVLNERHSLGTLVGQIEEAFGTRPDLSFEVVFVDDGSTDGTWRVIAGLAAAGRARGVRLRRNLGKATALKVGVSSSTGHTIVTMDGDLQDDPAEVPRFLDALDSGYDLVSGWKRERNDPLSKRVPSRLFNSVTGLVTGVKLHDHNCGFKAARREVFEQVPLYGELHRFVPTAAQSLGFRVGEIPVNHRARAHGRSKYGLERYVRGMIDLLTVVSITRYGRRPGHLFGGLGLLAGAAGFGILAYLTGVWAFTSQSIGARPLLSLGVLLEVLAVHLLSLGVVAELLLHRTSQQPPGELAVHELAGPR